LRKTFKLRAEGYVEFSQVNCDVKGFQLEKVFAELCKMLLRASRLAELSQEE
jgi:hypothetical protein